MPDEKKFRTEVPNIIDDLGLDPHERALYVHYKRACGGNDCEWVESIRITGQRTKMSFSRASMARKSLVNRGLIHLIPKGNDGTAVKIVNIWELNTVFYQQEDRPDIDGWTVKQLIEWCQGVHNMNTINEEAPKNETKAVGVHIMNEGVHIMNNKKEPLKKLSSKDDSGKPPTQPAFSEEFTLLPDTPETQFLFEKVNTNRNANGRGNTKKFKSLEQKKKCLEAAIRLGSEKFSEGIEAGLRTGLPAELAPLVNWIAKYTGNGATNGQQKQQYPSPDDRPKPAAGAPKVHTGLSAAFKAGSRGSGGSP